MLTIQLCALVAPLCVLISYVIPYIQNKALRSVPGPRLAAFSKFWLFYQARQGRRWEVVDSLHQRLGPLVRIQPNHVSVSSPDAIQVIYGHGNGFLKRSVFFFFFSFFFPLSLFYSIARS
jgi:benzoate 4-monooxygenase